MSKMKKPLAIMSLFCALLTGCKTINKMNAVGGYGPAGVFDSSSFKASDIPPLPRNDIGQIQVASKAFEELYTKAKSDKQTRNYIITQTLLASDQLVEGHKKYIISGQATVNAGLSIGTSAAAGLATIFEPPGTKSALSAGAFFLNATRSTINEQFYLNQLSTGIIREITVAREEIKEKIVANMSLDHDKYPIDSALADLRDYHERGSMLYGLVALTGMTKKIPESRVEINQRIEDLKKAVTYIDSVSASLAGSSRQEAELQKQELVKAIGELSLQLKDAPR